MTIIKVNTSKNLILCPPTKTNSLIENYQPCSHRYQEENLCSLLTLDEALKIKNKTKDNIINGFIHIPSTIGFPMCQMFKAILDDEAQEDPLEIPNNDHIPMKIIHNSIPIEIDPGKTFNISVNMDN